MIKNQRGVVSTEFVFGFFVTMGLLLVTIALSYTLSVLEITQYVIFSASRAHLASNADVAAQKKAAVSKYASLTTGKSVLGKLYSQGWFTVLAPSALDVRSGTGGTNKNFSRDLAGGGDSDHRGWFLGVSTKFVSNMMTFHVPFLGVTSDDDDAFSTHLNAMLIRESSQDECRTFFQDRGEKLSNLPSSGFSYNPTYYVPLEDNGC